MLDEHYLNPRLVQLYDHDSGWSEDRDFYLSLANLPSMQILDLGCGTGLLCDAFASRGHKVVGADPSNIMLDSGRIKPNGKLIEWVHSSAQNFRSEKRFDLIIMTGHAFQVLIDDADISATLQTVYTHLAQGGIFVFESRNPKIDWASNWDYDMQVDAPVGTVHESRRFLNIESEILTFELNFEFPDETLKTKSKLRFAPREKIETQLKAVGLRTKEFYGDWNRKPFNDQASLEMIFVCEAS